MWEWNPDSKAFEYHYNGYRCILRSRNNGSWYMGLYVGSDRVMSEWTPVGTPVEHATGYLLDRMAHDMKESLHIYSSLGI